MTSAEQYFAARWLAVVAAVGIASFAVVPAWASADPHKPISDDGSRTLPHATAAVGSSSFSGTGRVLMPGVTDDALANFPSADTAADIARIRRAKPTSGSVERGSVIGSDDRVNVARTTAYPARATALIIFDNDFGGTVFCTGWFINKDTIATAGHCVGDGGSGKFNPRSSYRIYPGRNGASSPYGSCTAKRLSTVAGWLDDGRDDYDYAAIKLNCSIGNTVGWYGYTVVASPINLKIAVQGYPGDKPSSTQWKAGDKIRVVQERRLFYQADTFGGESGAAVLYFGARSCDPCALAVHAYGAYGGPPYRNNNHGTRITSSVAANLTRWKNAP